MMRHLPRLFGDVLVYAGGTLAAKGAALLLVPLYARYLTPAEYGALALLNALDAALTTLLGLGLASAIMKSYHDYASPRNPVVSTATWATALFSLVSGYLLWTFSAPLAQLVLGSAEQSALVRITVAATCLGLLRVIALSALRLRGQTVAYVALNLAYLALLVGLNVVQVGWLGRGIGGAVESNLYASAALWLYCLAFLVRREGLTFSLDALRGLLRFGLPLVPGGLALWVMSWSDHQFLRVYRGQAEVGLYAMVYKFGMIVNMLLVQPFRTAWLPFVFSSQRSEHARRIYAVTLTGLLVVGAALFLIVAVPAREWLRVLTTAAYLPVSAVIPLIALAYLCYGVYLVVDVGVLLTGRTSFHAWLAGLGAALNLGLNLTLISRWGIMGAAAATLLSYLCLALAMLVVSQRLYPIPYEWPRLGKLAAITAALYGSGSQIHTGSLVGDLAARMGWIATLPLWLLAVRFFRPAELAALTEAGRRLCAWIGRSGSVVRHRRPFG